MSADFTTDNLKYEVKNRVAWVTLDRPEAMNALNTGLLKDVQRAFDEIDEDDDVFVVVMIGNGGRAFSAGADLKEMASRQAAVAPGGKRTAGGLEQDSAKGFGPMEAVNDCRKPVIAAVDGYCLAGGFELSIYCDIRIATRKSTFGLPEGRRSLLAGAGLITLPRLIPLGEALRIAITSSPISAERAYQIGLVQELAEDRDDLLKVLQGIVGEILLCAPLAVREIKRVVRDGRDLPVQDALKLRELLSSAIAQTEDALEGPRAFAEKREPKWQGR
jgi:enoyl-CoA hydratase/carnithine racemase